MKTFKKGIALIAVLAFLITAALPAAGLAADITPRVEPQSMTAGQEGTVIFTGGFSNAQNGVCPYGTYTITSADGPAIPITGLNIANNDAGNQTVTITIPAGTPGFTEPGGPYHYTLNFQLSGSSRVRPVANFELTVVSGEPAATYTVTAGEGIASVNPASAEEGATVSVTPAQPAAGHRVTAVTAVYEGGSVSAVRQQDGTWTFTMPAANVTVNATVEEAGLYEVNVLADPEDVQVETGESPDGYYAGETVTVVADPEKADGTVPTTIRVTQAGSGAAVTVTCADQALGEYTFEMPASDVNVDVIYGAKTTSAVSGEGGITVSPERQEYGQPVTVTLPADVNPADVLVIGADGTRYPLTGPNADGTYSFTMPNQAVAVTDGVPEPAVTIPKRPAAGIYTGTAYLNDPANAPAYENPFTYWTQPKSGLFDDGQEYSTEIGSSNRPPAPEASVPWEAGSINGNFFQIGPENVYVSPSKAAPAGGFTNPPRDLKTNDRIEIYYNPENITVNVPAAVSADGRLQLNEDNWSNYVTMEWEFKPSTNDEDDGTPNKIPAGFGFSGVRSPLLTISPLTASMDRWWVRLLVVPLNSTLNGGGTGNEQVEWATRWVRLDLSDVRSALDPVVTLSSNPEAVGSIVTVSRGSDAVLTAKVENQPVGSTNTYQWQSLARPTAANPTPSWANVAGATDQSLVLPGVTDAQSGVSYQCLVTCRENGPAGLGTVNSSNSLTLNVVEPNGSVFVAGTTPSNVSATGEEKLIYRIQGQTFSAAVSAKTDNGDPVKYQWYVRSYLAPVPASVETVADAAAYLAGAAAQPMDGATAVSMTSEPLRVGVYGFSCRVENANNPAMSANSPVIYVVVGDKAQLNVYPEPGTVKSVGVVNGQSVTLTANAKVPNVSYSWERYNSATGQWSTLTATGRTLTLPALTTTATGTLYRCKVSATEGEADPVYSGWYLINVWDTANTPQITKTAQNIQWTQSQLQSNAAAAVRDGKRLVMMESTAKVAQDLIHGEGPVVAIWYNKDGAIVSAQQFTTAGSSNLSAVQLNRISAANAGNAAMFTSEITNPQEGSYTSTLCLSGNGTGDVKTDALAAIAANSANASRRLNGEYTCVWYKPQNTNEWLQPTVYGYPDPAPANVTDAMVEAMYGDLRLLAPQAVRGSTTIRIQVPCDPWIITDLPDEMTVAVGRQATLSVAAVITQPCSTTQPVYTWQVTDASDPGSAGAVWRNCLSSDGTGQFTNTFTTRVMTQDDFDTSTTLTYRVIVASRPNITKIVSGSCTLQITEGTPGAPEIVPGAGSSITVENGQATGVTVSKTGTTVSQFLTELNMVPVPGCTVRIAGSDGQVLASDAIVYTGCILQLVDDATQEVVAQATIIVAGDVLGTGIIAINQVVRMAQDLNGSRPLAGIYVQAGDFNGSGAIDIADLVREAQILSEPIDVQ